MTRSSEEAPAGPLARLPDGIRVLQRLVDRPAEGVARATLDGRHVAVRASARRAHGAFAELEALLAVRIPGVPALVDFGLLAGGGLWVAREWVEGRTLAEFASQAGSADLAPVFADVALALAGLHAAGIAHGDLSPSNVLVDDGGRGRLVDLGLAAAERSGADSVTRTIRGTPPFVAPEALAGAPATPAADLFALGALLAHFAGPGLPDARQLYGRFPAAPFLEAAELETQDLAEWARASVPGLVRRDPAQRTSDAFCVALALGASIDGIPVVAPRLDPLFGRDRALQVVREKPFAWVLTADDEVERVARAAAVRRAVSGEHVEMIHLGPATGELRTTLQLDRFAESVTVALGETRGADGVLVVALSGLDAWARAALDTLHAAVETVGARLLVFSGLADAPEPSVDGPVWARGESVRLGPAGADDLELHVHARTAVETEALGRLVRALTDAGQGSSTRVREALERATAAGAFDRRGVELVPNTAYLPALGGPAPGAALPELGPDARAGLLRLVLAGRPLGARIVGGDVVLQELLQLGLVAREAGRVRLVDTGRGALEVEPDRGRRVEAHRWLAEALERRGAAEETTWGHRLLAGDPVQGISDEAAALAARGLHARVARGLERARQQHEAEGRPLAAPLARFLVHALARAGDTTGARRVARALGSPALEAAVRAIAALRRAQHAEAAEAFSEAGEEDLASIERLHAAVWQGDLERVLEGTAEVDTLLGELAGGDLEARQRAAERLGVRAHALGLGGGDAIGLLNRALDAAERGPHASQDRVVPALLVNRANFQRGADAAAAEADLERALDHYAGLESVSDIAQVQSLMGGVLRDRRDLVRAEAVLVEALARRSRMAGAVLRALTRGSLGLVRVERGHHGAALDDLTVARDVLGAEGNARHLPVVERALRQVEASLGRAPSDGDPPMPSPEDAEFARALAEDHTTEEWLARAEDCAAHGLDRLAARAALAAYACARGDGVRAADARRTGERALGRVLEGLDTDERAMALRTLVRAADPRPADVDTWLDDTEDDVDVMRILRLNESLVREEDSSTLLDAITVAALEVTGAERGFIVIERDGVLELDTAFDTARGDVADDEIEWSRSVVAEALERGEPVRLADAVDSVDWGAMRSIESIGLRSILAAPFRANDTVRGVIVVDDVTRPGAFGPREERLLGLLAGQAALSLRQVLRLEEIRALSTQLRERVAVQSNQLGDARRALAQVGRAETAVEGMVGDSKAIQAVRELLVRVAPAEIPVLVVGESGTGKEVAARAIHALSPRAKGPFVTENCAALPANLVESELFGAAKGAFTGADKDRAGLFERAEGGTLFLDEIGELPIEAQAKLLRVLETRRVRRVGDDTERPVDFRLVSATNRDLEAEAAAGRFRSDLLFRIDGVRVRMPSLAERVSDIPILVDHFLRLEEARSEVRKSIASEVVDRLEQRPWPGNVRELANEVRRLVILSDATIADPTLVRDPAGGAQSAHAGGLRTIAELERDAILDAVERFDGDKRKAAEALGISRAKVYQRLKEWGIG